jgi:gliding motility-associated-like protein
MNGCKNIDSVHVLINQLPAIDAGIASPICIGDSIQLNAIGGNSYVWAPVTNLSNPNISNPFADPLITTEYFVTGTDNNSCANIDSVTVVVNPLPVVTVDGGSGVGIAIFICRGDTATLTATGGNSYVWTPPININNALTSSPEVYPDNTSTYYVSVTDANGCVNNDSIIVNVFRITVSPDTAICEGDSVQLFAFGPNALSYTWAPSTGLNNPSVQNPWISPSSTTTYTVSATDINLCSDIGNVTVTVNAKPTALFSVVYSPSCSGILADFTNESINADSYLWNFHDGNTSTLFNVSHIFPYNASFIATLIAINNGNCSDTMSIQNNINSFQDYFSISVPNVITPNDDGINDYLEIKLSGDVSDCFSFTIFDRWGLKMFSSNRAKLQWDGRTTSGLKVVAGTYFYVLTINEIQYKGFITLLE